jgi:hypothetical protein
VTGRIYGFKLEAGEVKVKFEWRITMNDHAENNPRYHAQKVETKLQALIDHLRDDIDKVDDPRAEALFETSAEVLQGLQTAFQHYAEKSEAAWR